MCRFSNLAMDNPHPYPLKDAFPTISAAQGGELCFWEWLQWSHHPHLQDVVRCSEVHCNCSCSCTCSVVDVVEVAML